MWNVTRIFKCILSNKIFFLHGYCMKKIAPLSFRINIKFHARAFERRQFKLALFTLKKFIFVYIRIQKINTYTHKKNSESVSCRLYEQCNFYPMATRNAVVHKLSCKYVRFRIRHRMLKYNIQYLLERLRSKKTSRVYRDS